MSAFEDAVIQRIKQLEREVERLQKWEQPVGNWKAYTPTVTAAYGTITSYSASGVYCKIGKIVHYNFYISITNNGTGSGYVIATLPVTVTGHAIGAGRENTQSGNMLQLFATGTEIRIFDYKNSYPAVNNSVMFCSITYQAA